MTARAEVHPAADTLVAFGLGKADAATVVAVAGHLETCSECRARVADLTGDSFVSGLRKAAGRPDGTPVPDKSLSGVAGALNDKRGPVPPDLPPGLGETYCDFRKLGEGGMGVVYLARHKLMEREEVLKVLNRGMLTRPGAVERFLREIQSAARLDHENVVKAHTALQFDEAMVFVMQYVPGEDLAQVIDRTDAPLPVLNACYYVQQAARGLQHAHEKGLVHRDIKPSNLILTKDGKKHTVKILDFGLAKATSEAAFDSGLTGDGKMMGTPAYMAPEQATDAAKADIRADIYSLGCTLHFLLTGDPPFPGGLKELLYHHEHTEAPRLDVERPEVPVELADVVAKMLAKDPGARYQTPAEVAKALTPFLKRRGENRGPDSVWAAETVNPVGPTPPVARAESRPAASRPESGDVELVAVSPPSPTVAPGGVWGSLTDQPAPIVPAEPTATSPKPTQAAAPARRRPPWMWPAVAGGVVLAALAIAAAAGLFKVKTKDGTIVIENVPPDAEVLVDGEKVTITRNGEAVTVEAVKEGPHKLKVVRGGTEVWASDATVMLGGDPVRMRMEPPAAPAIPPIGTSEPPGPAKITDRSAGSRGTVTWSKVGDVLVGESSSGVLVFGDPAWTDYVLSADVRVVSGPPEFSLSARVAPGPTRARYDLKIGTFSRTADLWAWPRAEAESQGPIVTVPKRLRFGDWNRVQLSVVGDRVRAYAGPAGDPLGPPVLERTDTRARAGRVALGIGYPQQQEKAVIQFKDIRVTDPSGNVLWEGLPDLPKGDDSPGKSAEELEKEKEGIAKLKRALLDHKWHYLDNLFPPGAAEQFFPNGTFSNWKWKYWVVGPQTMRVHYDRNQTNKDTGILFTFNEDLTKFTAQFTDTNGRVHKITGTRR